MRLGKRQENIIPNFFKISSNSGLIYIYSFVFNDIKTLFYQKFNL